MVTSSEMITLWWLFIASQFSFHYIAQHNDEAKNERVNKELEQLSTKIQEVTLNKCCDYCEK